LQNKVAAALVFLSANENVKRAVILREWKRVTTLLSVKHDKV
jgi:hypothetical protein